MKASYNKYDTIDGGVSMPQKSKRVAVIGGANVDIGGFPQGTLIPGDSNPGKVRMSAGGVGRNIAENMARMGLQVELITALGEDANGRMLMEDCLRKGIGMEHAIRVPDMNTSVYLFIDDARGDMQYAINDMAIQAQITPENLAKRMDLLNGMDAVVMDANLPEDAILYIAENLRAPLFVDPVSVAKAGKLRRALKSIYCLKPNRIEAEHLAGMQIRDFVDAAEATRRLVQAGVQRVMLTMADQGAICADASSCIFLPNTVHSLVNTTGAGDAFTAALVWAHCEGLDLRQSGVAGMAAAGIALASLETVSSEMSRSLLVKRMADVSARMQ